MPMCLSVATLAFRAGVNSRPARLRRNATAILGITSVRKSSIALNRRGHSNNLDAFLVHRDLMHGTN